MTYPNIIFDLDGTLTDSREGIIKCFHHALASLGRSLPEDEDLSWCLGPPLEKAMTMILARWNDDRVEAACAAFRERYARLGMYENQVYPGVVRALETLSRRGKRLFVGTSKRGPLARKVLEHFQLEGFFKGIYGSEPGGLDGKAELLGHLIRSEGLSPADTIMVGDRKHDVEGALANRLDVLGVTYGYGDAEELSRAGATRLCPSARDLPKWL